MQLIISIKVFHPIASDVHLEKFWN
uniref:Uncharacterized protein n=1 Tax=Arundo donax TaxID=35708 RepID=A0A0A9B2K6_ARUDO